MGRIGTYNPTTSGGRLSQVTVETPPAEPTAPPQPNLIQRTAEDVAAYARGEVTPMQVAREIPQTTVNVGKAFLNTFVPAITNFFKTTGSIMGEGLAYAVDKNVRKQYGAGNLDILPTVTNTTQADLAKATIAAGIETAVYRSFPNIAQMKLVSRGGAGALQGLGFAISEGLAKNESPEEIVKKARDYGVGGAVLGIVTPYIVPLLKSEVKTLPEEIRGIFRGIVDEAKPPRPTRLNVVSEAKEPTRIPISTPNSRYEAWLRTQGYEPYIPESQLPTIEFGAKPKSTLPVIQTEATPIVPSAAGKLVPETPAPRFTPAKVPEPTLPTVEPVVSRVTEVPREQLPVGTGEQHVSRLEARVKEALDTVPPNKAEEAGISVYNQMNKADQISRATSFVTRSEEDALAVLRGEKQAPAGLLHNSIALALEKKAESAANANLAVKLASLRSTRFGQEISILTEADKTNPISAIEEIIKVRAGRATRAVRDVTGTVRRTVSEGSGIVRGAEMKIEEAQKLLDSIVC